MHDDSLKTLQSFLWGTINAFDFAALPIQNKALEKAFNVISRYHCKSKIYHKDLVNVSLHSMFLIHLR